MKRTRLLVLLLCMALTAMFAFSACGGGGEEAAEPETKILSEEELLNIAFNDAGFDITAGSDIKISVAVETGTRNVSFKIGDAEYSYDIDVNTGEIVNSVKPDVAPEVVANPVEMAMNECEKLPEFKNATNISVVPSDDKITITFDSGTESYEYVYDVETGTLEQQ